MIWCGLVLLVAWVNCVWLLTLGFLLFILFVCGYWLVLRLLVLLLLMDLLLDVYLDFRGVALLCLYVIVLIWLAFCVFRGLFVD